MRATSTTRRLFRGFLISITAAISISAGVGRLPAAAPNSSVGALPASRLPAAKPATQEGVPRFGHVFLIIGKNTTYDHLNSTNAPYLMGTIRPKATWLTQYYAATHWSQANYVALVSGQFTSCEQKDYGALCHQNVENLFHQLDLAHLRWMTWLEGGSAKCDTGPGRNLHFGNSLPVKRLLHLGQPRHALRQHRRRQRSMVHD
jgi:hypothetical protein